MLSGAAGSCLAVVHDEATRRQVGPTLPRLLAPSPKLPCSAAKAVPSCVRPEQAPLRTRVMINEGRGFAPDDFDTNTRVCRRPAHALPRGWPRRSGRRGSRAAGLGGRATAYQSQEERLTRVLSQTGANALPYSDAARWTVRQHVSDVLQVEALLMWRPKRCSACAPSNPQPVQAGPSLFFR